MLFERALDDEPAPPPGDLTAVVMAQGARLRRRRAWLIEGAVAAGLAALVGLNLATSSGYTPTESAAGQVTTACPTDRDLGLFLRTDITARQRADLDAALHSDTRLTAVRYESKAQAFERFKALWRDSPDFAKSVSPQSLPESFRVTVVRPADIPAAEARFRQLPGVQDVSGTPCHPRVASTVAGR